MSSPCGKRSPAAEVKRRADRNVVEQPAVLDVDARRGQIGQLQKRARRRR